MNIGQKAKSECRADLYHALAEALAEPPDWLAFSGRDWPLTKAAAQLGPVSEAAADAAKSLAQIPAEPLTARQARYSALFAGPGRPFLWLYEAMVRNGRFLHPTSLEIEQLYQACGLQMVGAELPDHASMELAFLAHLTRQQTAEPDKKQYWQKAERLFMQKHAGCWLPEIGRSLANTNDTVYAPIGRLLNRWLQESNQPSRLRKTTNSLLPQIPLPFSCTLCGFCVQECPTHALIIHETAQETSLWLNISACTGCRKCARVCVPNALKLHKAENGLANAEELVQLRRSPRARCASCGQATISQAEMDFVAAQIGNPPWLLYCLTCRAHLMENIS